MNDTGEGTAAGTLRSTLRLTVGDNPSWLPSWWSSKKEDGLGDPLSWGGWERRFAYFDGSLEDYAQFSRRGS